MRLEISDITKIYRRGTPAVAGVTMDLGVGLHGLLGPNGAGKSSLLRIIATITRPTSGTVRWNGDDVVARPRVLRSVLGYLPQDFGVYPNLTAPEFLRYVAAVKGLSARSARARVDELLEVVNLTDARARPLGTYSGGMRQRVGIAQALLNDPALLIADEPMVGLDPEERLRVRDLLSDLARDRVVILSTHIVSDIAAAAGDITVMAGGRLRRRGTVAQLVGTVDGLVWEVDVPATAVDDVRRDHLIVTTSRDGGMVRARVIAPTAPLPGAVAVAPGLEDAYLHAVHPGAPRQTTAVMGVAS